jgi:hypothetical protein
MFDTIFPKPEVDNRSSCTRDGHNFGIVALHPGMSVSPPDSYFHISNVSPYPFASTKPDVKYDTVVVPLFCSKCGESRKLVY